MRYVTEKKKTDNDWARKDALRNRKNFLVKT